MCHIRIHGKNCHRKGCGEEVPISDFVVMKGEDGELHTYHESCHQEELWERLMTHPQPESYEMQKLAVI